MKRYQGAILLVVSATLLVFGIVELFEQRFESSDVYPQYSTLRSDPLGAMAIYESLERLPGISVRQDFSVGNVLPPGEGTTFVLLALPEYGWKSLPEDLFAEIDRFVNEGGRFAIALYPEFVEFKPLIPDNPQSRPEDPPKPTPHRNRWGLNFKVVEVAVEDSSTFKAAVVRNVSQLALKPSIDWHSGLVATNLNPEWVPIYMRGADPVVIERRFGRGSVVVATDSYFLSNEAMTRDRHTDLAAWFIGSNRNVVFDEAHLGTTQNPGIATLMRAYHLQWFLLSLALLAGLFIWKSSFSLIPVREGAAGPQFVMGRDAASGFVNLLRRNIPRAEVLTVAFKTWRESLPQFGGRSASRLKKAEDVFGAESALPARDRDPVRAYRKISEVLQTHTAKETK
jgi:hypothetical protein